ncbi:MAG TPA: HWE histidine kinase domain-containing protein, partial [Xanthobacteraceae bacterium]|nr:HWE histidine kinase domain-containing protein [Xanthobacteraceae bacterium]
LLAAGLLIAKLYVDQAREALTAQAYDIVADATAAIDQELNRYRLALQVLASSEALAEGKFEQFYPRAKALSQSVTDSVIALRRTDGEAIFVTSLPLSAPIPKLTDAGLRAADRLAIEHRSAVISDMVTGPVRPNVVALEMPVVVNDKVDYLLTLAISPKGVLDILAAHLRGSRWLMGVVDNNDRIIARSWDNERFAGQKVSDEFIRNTQAKGGSFIGTTLEGTAVFNVYQRSELSGWRIAAGIPLSDLEAPLHRSLLVLAIVTGVGLAASLILAFFYARALARPLRQLQGVAETGGGSAKTVPTGIAELDGVTGTLMRSIIVLKDRDRARARTVNELNHRMKNMLAIIQAIANETRRRATSLEQFGKAFEGRLMALARSHEALGDREWHGGDLAALITQCCKPFCDEERLELQGPPIELPPKATVGIGMVIHELATNAAKHGALSVPIGKVKVRWDLPEEDGLRILRLQWQEQDGPPMPSTRKEGFGSVLLRSIIERDLGGRLDMIFSRDGLLVIACIPMTALMGPSIVPQGDPFEAAGTDRG